ncbi:uncharacterized protein LOC118413417 [Branchiostoma floridae]|uniref:Uncharacterized protein LOC118413417 n=1 Tax=Branchiostoma floridae TaxID=7739 RepID=A0A9J7KYJ3_BRAFL|nr:uncharacterized protein LOC118413417 [Branchiostoma floridae]
MNDSETLDKVVKREIVPYDKQADVFSIDHHDHNCVITLAQFYSERVGRFMWINDRGEVRCDGDVNDNRTFFNYYVGENEIVRFVARGGKYRNFAISLTNGELRPFHTAEPPNSDMGDPSTQFVRSRGSDFDGQLVKYQSKIDSNRYLAFDQQGNPQPLGFSNNAVTAGEFICWNVAVERETAL